MKASKSGLAVLVSGAGSIMEAVAEAGVPIDLVVADRECATLTKAQRHGIETLLLKRTNFNRQTFDYVDFSSQVVAALQSHGINKVAMAGWMTIFAEPMFRPETYAGRVLNTHPSLLPAFKGGTAVKDALAYGVKVTGCTIHVATPGLDAGPIVAQEPVRVEPVDTLQSLHERIKRVERKLYVETVKQWVEGRLKVVGLAS